MADYKAPIEEVSFVLNELLDISQLNAIPYFEEASSELIAAVIEEAGKFSAEVLRR
jgi:hypothetical protein